MRLITYAIGIVVVAGVAGVILTRGDTATLPFVAGTGPTPQLPKPVTSVLPTVHIAPAKGWPEGGKPIAADGLSVQAYASGLAHPRMLHVLPNGDVLVAESNGPERPDDSKGPKGWAMQTVMKIAGAGVPSPNRIVLLRGLKADGTVELKTVFLEGLNSPFGMALVGNDFYVANTDAIVRFPYVAGATKISEPGTKLTDLPAGTINHHWTKDLLASRDGKRLYASVGSNSNVGENGVDKEENRAAVLEVDRASGQWRVFASGLRNPNGLTWRPGSDELWAVVNERDELGSDLVPDYLTSVKPGAFYGWPYSYYGQHVDTRVAARPDMVAKAIPPDYALGTHVAPLGLAFTSAGAFVGQHGSWNRKPRSGYNVVFIPFVDGKPQGQPSDVLSGFVDANGRALGRPVGVALDNTGALLVADDVGNTIWRVTPKEATPLKGK